MASRQLLVYRFEPGSRFEGQLVGALERIESGGAIRVLDVLFVAREPDGSELAAVSFDARGRGDMTGRLLGFRLDPAERRVATERALQGAGADTVRELGAKLAPGCAVAAVLLEHVWASALEEAVARVGGSAAADELVDARRLSELTPRLVAAAGA